MLSKSIVDVKVLLMTLEEKIERSKSSERIDFSKIGCELQEDPLLPVQGNERIMVEPVWLIPNDFEGKMYADYIEEHPKYDRIWVRSGLLERLERAASALPKNMRLVVHAGHRPIEVQKRLIRDVMEDYKKDNTSASDEQALEHARTFVSDPDIKLPPHCCGAAVDVELFDTDKQKLVDFGSPINMDHEISYLHNNKITFEQKGNRMLLLSTLLDAGFASYYAEWWHFSYGDEIWAWFYKNKNCLYGLANIHT